MTHTKQRRPHTQEAEEWEEGYPQGWLTRVELPVVAHAHLLTRPLDQFDKISTEYRIHTDLTISIHLYPASEADNYIKSCNLLLCDDL